MSVHAIAWASKLTLPPRDKFVLIALCDHYNESEGAAWMKQSTLAEWTCYRRDTVNAALHDLEYRHGLIQSEARRYPDGRNASKVYRILRVGETDSVSVGETDSVPASVGETDPVHVGETDTDSVGETDNRNRQHRSVNIEPLLSPPTPPHAGDRTRSASADDPRSPPGFRDPPADPAPAQVWATSSTASPGAAQGGSTAARQRGALVAARASPSMREQVEAVVDAYNENRGELPKVMRTTGKREKRVRSVIKELGFDEARSAIAIAAMEVSKDRFWLDRGYGFDNLLAGDKFVQKAETAVARGRPGRDPARDGAERIKRALEERFGPGRSPS